MAPRQGSKFKVVVDGSNLATEGRTDPNLQQLNEAVTAYIEENPKAEIIVVVDASFDHRITPSERARFKEAELAGEVVTTPAGAVGRGDAFILKIAARIGAVVLSNDSFQEFHAEHPWLFDEGRLVGGKPVPGVGWVFTPRQPVRGAKSTRAVKKLTVGLPGGVKPVVGATITPAKASTKKSAPAPVKSPAKKSDKKVDKPAAKKADRADKAEKTATKRGEKKPASPAKKADKAAAKAPAKAPAKKATKAAAKPVKETASTAPAVALRRGRQPVNPEADFAKFTAAHRTRSLVDGEVVAFSSHGAIIAVNVDGNKRVECYAPTTSLGVPPPARARDVLKRGDKRSFRLVSVDRDRRIAELALP